MSTTSFELPVSEETRIAARAAGAASTARHRPGSTLPSANQPAGTAGVGRLEAGARRLCGDVSNGAAGLGRLVARAATGSAVVLLLMVVGLLAFRAAYDDRVFPAVYVGDNDLGGLTRDEARAVLTEQAEEIEHGLLTVSHEDRIWTPTLTELGVRVDVDASLDAALTVGREATAVDRLGATGLLINQDRRLPLVLELDDATLNGWFDRVQSDLGQTPHDAYLAIEGTSVRIEPEVEGTTIDRAAAREMVASALSGLSPVFAPLPVTPWVSRVRAGDLAEAKVAVEQALARPVEASFEGDTWTITPEEFSPFVVQQVSPDPAVTGAAAVVVGVDEAALSTWLNERFGAEVNREPVEPEVGWNGERVIALGDGVDGIRLRPKRFGQDLAASFFGEHAPVEVAVSAIPPAVDEDNLDSLGITTQLARGDSNYDGGGTWERSQNIEVGTALLNGTLVPPHTEFSFNRAIGEITEDKGYVTGAVIVAERVGRDLGGGICQVSTTVFRAALLAGLPITEWWPHTYRIAQYEHEGWGPGYDASILQPEGDPFGGGDFKFLNPTDSWLLVEAWTTGVHIIVNIYGPDLGYAVEFSDTSISEPIVEGADMEIVNYELPAGTIRQTEYPLTGLATSFTRWVYDRDGTLIEEREFFTRFKGRSNVYQVSPDMVGQSPAAY